jgi:hypothetical protein
MWWVVAVVAVFGVLVFFEWRSRNEPLTPGLRDHWGPHSASQNVDRPLTGGHDADKHG